MNIRTPLAAALTAVGAVAVTLPVIAQADTTTKTRTHTVQRTKGADGQWTRRASTPRAGCRP